MFLAVFSKRGENININTAEIVIVESVDDLFDADDKASEYAFEKEIDFDACDIINLDTVKRI